MRRLLLASLLLAGCATSGTPQFEERLVDVLPEGKSGRYYRFTGDGQRVAYVLFDGRERDRVVVNRIAGKPMELI
jgi:hypothetical protein